MSRSTDPGHFFQTRSGPKYRPNCSLIELLIGPSHSLAETTRKASKSKNNFGSPIRLQSKILAVIADPEHAGAIYVAESAGTARRVVLDVGESPSTSF